MRFNIGELLAVVVAQLAEWSLATSEIRGLNPNIGKVLSVHICQLQFRKDENKEKEAGIGLLKKHRRTLGACFM